MDISTLVREPSRVHAILKELPNGRVVTTVECKIYIPVRYAERKLAYISNEIYILGIYAIVVEDRYYAISLLNTMVPIDPTETNVIKINNEGYYEFVFSPGSTVFKTTDLVKADALIYRIYDEFLAMGHIPWFVGYEDLGKIFDSAKEFAGANIGTNPEITQLIASLIARDPKDRTNYYRTVINSPTDLVSNPPIFIPLKSVQYSATNTTTKLGGSYFQQGVISALIDPSTRSESIETLLLA